MSGELQLESALALVGVSVWSAAWKGAFLFGGAGFAAGLLRHRSAAIRHALWTATAICALLLPTLELTLPRWSLPQSATPLTTSVPMSGELAATSTATDSPQREMHNGSLLAMVAKDDAAAASSAEIRPEFASSVAPAVISQGANVTSMSRLPGWSLATWVGAVWIVGFVVSLAPVVYGVWMLSRLRRRGERIVNGKLWAQCQDTAALLGFCGPIELVLSNRHGIPMTWGFLRPVLLLPREALNWSEPRLRMVLLHELAHMQRADYLSQLLGQLMRAAHWFNPLAWWSLRKLRCEAEQACDDMVLAAGADAADYAEQLVCITTNARGGTYAPAPALGMGRAARLQWRVQAILDPMTSRQPLSVRAAGSILVVMLVITGVTAAYGAVARGADLAQEPVPAAANVATPTAQEQKSDPPPKPASKPAAEPVAKPAVVADKNGNVVAGASGDAVAEVRNLIQKQFAGKGQKDERALTEAAIRGMLQELNDPYSEFLSQEKLQEFERQLQGSVDGIGAQLSRQNINGRHHLFIAAPLPGSPAQKAGLRAGDAIVSIDGMDTRELTMEQAVGAIRGQSGTQVRLKIHRSDGGEEEIAVMRGAIPLASVKGLSVDREGIWNHWLNKDSSIGYVRITEFRNRTTKDFESALRQLAGMKGLILDLRECSGGQLTVAVEVANLLLEKGTIVSTTGPPSALWSYSASGKAIAPSVPLVVLIDDKTASAAEIVAGALKDNDRAILLGARTFGKGSVQSLHTIAGQGAVKITTAHFKLPGGRMIDRQAGSADWGVDPTDGYFVPLSAEEQNRQRWIRMHKDLPATTPLEAANMTEAELSRDFYDAQLAAALQTMTARISQGAFIKTGRSEEQLRAYYERQDQLRKQREAALKALADIDSEISKLSP